MFWIKWTAAAIAFIALSGISIKAYGAWHWAESTKAMYARLEAARAPMANAPYDPREP